MLSTTNLISYTAIVAILFRDTAVLFWQENFSYDATEWMTKILREDQYKLCLSFIKNYWIKILCKMYLIDASWHVLSFSWLTLPSNCMIHNDRTAQPMESGFPNTPYMANGFLKVLTLYTWNRQEFLYKNCCETRSPCIKLLNKLLQLWKKLVACMEDSCIFLQFHV